MPIVVVWCRYTLAQRKHLPVLPLAVGGSRLNLLNNWDPSSLFLKTAPSPSSHPECSSYPESLHTLESNNFIYLIHTADISGEYWYASNNSFGFFYLYFCSHFCFLFTYFLQIPLSTIHLSVCLPICLSIYLFSHEGRAILGQRRS